MSAKVHAIPDHVDNRMRERAERIVSALRLHGDSVRPIQLMLLEAWCEGGSHALRPNARELGAQAGREYARQDAHALGMVTAEDAHHLLWEAAIEACGDHGGYAPDSDEAVTFCDAFCAAWEQEARRV